jgi:carbamoyltransferase
MMQSNIIGISAFFHDAACCLLQDGDLVAAAEEERFTRIKADPSAPGLALRYCLEEGGISIGDVDCIAYYENPEKKLARQLWSGVLGYDPSLLKRVMPEFVDKRIRLITGYHGPIMYVDHHISHAASSYYCSGFEESAIFTADGVGEWATTTYGTATRDKIHLFEEVSFPDSIGLLYSTITSYLGFGVNDGEYKVMGLAPYGKPAYADQFWKLIRMEEKGQFSLDMRYFDFMNGKTMFSPELAELFGQPPRAEDAAMDTFHKDVARSLQYILEEILVEKCNYLHERTGMENLSMAGGVALNCVANGQILKRSKFKKLYVQPAANDAGGAIGAAAMAYQQLTGRRPLPSKMPHAYWGPSYSTDTMEQLLKSTGLNYINLKGNYSSLLSQVARRLSQGKVIGWFQGRMEFGPRALGARSILADPRNPQMRDLINSMVKKREGFRPFAPAVMEDKMKDHFNIDHPSPFMLETCQVASPLSLPAITHEDGSARVQSVTRQTNERFYDLLSEFNKLTGCPILLNTSFNVKGEPIVCDPVDAVRCFITTDIDCLVMGDFIIDRSANSLDLMRVYLSRELPLQLGIQHDVYTFV